MAAISTKAGTRTLSIIGGAFFTAALFFGSAGTAQASDPADRLSPPSPAEIAMLRNLLALQHPSLKNSAPAPTSTTPALMPAVSSEPMPHDATTPTATEGEAAATPASSRISRLDVGFRASLERAVAAAGFAGNKL
jgi:hypothetical protein